MYFLGKNDIVSKSKKQIDVRFDNCDYYEMQVDNRIEEGVGQMCNLGDYIEAKAIKKGMELGRKLGMESVTVRTVRIQLEKKKRTLEETAELLNMPLGYIQKIADMLQTYAGASNLQIAEQLMNTGI